MPLPSVFADTIGGRRWERSSAGESGGEVWQLRADDGDELYLKYGRDVVADAIADEAARLRWLADRVPTATTVAFATEADAAWLLTRAVPGRTGDEWLQHDPSALPQVIAGFATFLRRLHALPIEDCPFEAGATLRLAAARSNVAAGLVDTDDFDDDHEGWSAAAVLAETERLADFAAECVVTHGDFSLGNLLFDDAGGVTGCIDVGRLGVADFYQDIAILWVNLAEYGADAQRSFLTAIGIDRPDEQRLAFHRCLDELF